MALPSWTAAALLLLLVAPPLAAQEGPRRESGPVAVTALAVEETSAGFVGVHATVEATVRSHGSGRVYVATKPLAHTDMQGSARLAAQVAASTLGIDWRQQDYLVSFTSGSQVIGGPSAGAVMTLALTVALHNLVAPGDPWTLDATVAGTGTINPDGTIGPVGGIPAKAEGAKAAGVTTFLFPAGLETATTQVPGRFGPQTVLVDMQEHCAKLGITCRPVARIEELLAAAAHVDLAPPAVPVPGTVDYAAILAPSVGDQVGGLSARLQALRGDARVSDLRAAERARVEAEVQAAADALQSAEGALGEEAYYRAATMAFQGAIRAGRAENLTAFYAGGSSEAVVLAALEACRAASDRAQEAANATAATYSALFAVGAAQGRAGEAANLRAQAEAAHAGAFTFNDWATSLVTSVHCVERSRTVAWWAELRHAFPGSLAVPDSGATAQQAVDDATDLVSYAQAVLASGGPQAGIQQAQARLESARRAIEAGWHPAAVVHAIEASSAASVALQSALGGAVPPAVLEAARQGAARAIDAARARGIEPILSVSLVELAQQGETAASLEAYWTARSLAVLDVVGGPGATAVAGPAAVPTRPGYGGGTLLAFLGTGAVLGLAASGLVVVALMARRR